MGFEIQQLLGSVRGLLRDHAHRQTQRHKMTNERLTLLL